jgi:hypothetical protein
MVNLLDDIQRALHAKAYYRSLLETLSQPGVCAAMEYPDGVAKSDCYALRLNTRPERKYRDQLTASSASSSAPACCKKNLCSVSSSRRNVLYS